MTNGGKELDGHRSSVLKSATKVRKQCLHEWSQLTANVHSVATLGLISFQTAVNNRFAGDYLQLWIITCFMSQSKLH